MNLADAIDALLSFVEAGPITPEGQRRDEFEGLDRAVWAEAKRAGYEADLPQPVADVPHMSCLGRTNLPGFWILSPPHFKPAMTREWASRLLDLKAIASIPAEEPKPSKSRTKKGTNANAVLALLGQESEEILKIAKGAGSLDDKMVEIVTKDKRLLGYTSKQWEDLLGVTDGRIRQTEFWKKIRKEMRTKA